MAQNLNNDTYWSSYGDIVVHELMLKDEPRTLAYKRFIEENTELFTDKIVVDVGAGTGILSLFAAKAGAKQVYAIEASEISKLSQEIVDGNGLSDKITILHGLVEDVQLPDNIKADVIISEWMGFYLFHESMLRSVIAARDKFLSPNGIILPSTASLYICPVSLKQYHKEHVQYWKDVYGFDFSPAVPQIKENMLSQPQILSISPSDCLSDPYLVTSLDLLYTESDDVKRIMSNPKFSITKYDVLHGFALWFDVTFEGDNPVTLTTGPSAPQTHWKQTITLLPDALLVSKGGEVHCNLVMSRDEVNERRYNICIEMPDEEDEDVEEEDCKEDSDQEVSEVMEVNDHNVDDTEMKDAIKRAMAEHS